MTDLKKLKNINKMIDSSPIIEIRYKFNNAIKSIFAKCEWFSLTGSIKDKAAYQIYFDAFSAGILKKGSKVVEVTSGNMGISLTAMGRLLGLDVTIIMPKNMSVERKQLLSLYGAHLVEVENFKAAFELCEKYKHKGYFCTQQFSNASNLSAHYNFTARKIYQKLKHKNVKNFVAGVGTGGTLCGAGLFLKQHGYNIIAIEPQNARILSDKPPFNKHALQGLSDEHKPALYNPDIVDKIIQVSDQDAIAITLKLCKQLSLGVGISSGANFLGAVLSGGNCVTVFADDNKKYLSTLLNNSPKSQLAESIQLIDFKVL